MEFLGENFLPLVLFVAFILGAFFPETPEEIAEAEKLRVEKGDLHFRMLRSAKWTTPGLLRLFAICWAIPLFLGSGTLTFRLHLAAGLCVVIAGMVAGWQKGEENGIKRRSEKELRAFSHLDDLPQKFGYGVLYTLLIAIAIVIG